MRSSHAAAPERLTRDGLLGVWRLVRIEYSGPHGSTVDPFYQAGSSGLLIYDVSGWMSVDIAAPGRRAFEVPGQRLSPDADGNLAAMKAAAFDGYYAYDGTWEFDAATSELIHHVVRSLLPAENGVTYTQKVSLEGGRLIFSNRSGANGEETLRRKIWERVERR
ncbi:MAG: lipocalin-like domain-containing protein [Steroidobacteraceae bacterium]